MPQFNRRGVLQGLLAVGAAPLMPVSAAASAPVAHTRMQFIWATLYAHMNNACSPAQIIRALGVSPNVADSLYAELLRKGVLEVPLTGGVARARKAMCDGLKGHRAADVAPQRRGINLDQLMRVVTRDISRQLPFCVAA